MLVPCGSVLEELDATAPSESERDWLLQKESQRSLKLEITGKKDKYKYILSGSICENLREIAGSMRRRNRRPRGGVNWGKNKLTRARKGDSSGVHHRNNNRNSTDRYLSTKARCR